LRAAGIEAVTVHEEGLAGRSDPEILVAAAEGGYALLTENVADFARIATERVASGKHHPGALIALSSRSSLRPHGISATAAAVLALADEDIEDRLVYLEHRQ
jgi:predicted nuclease of predicted toxin-antitoxin system